MTSILEKAISVIAPHRCFVCGTENNILCNACVFDVFDDDQSLCFSCGAPSVDGRVCAACSKNSQIEHVWIAGTYEGNLRKLIKLYKFDRAQAAAAPLAEAMRATLPYLGDIIVVPIPTAPARVRTRGYDHAKLLAKHIAKGGGWRQVDALRRRHNLRQVGATRALRERQADTAYELALADVVKGRHVLLVDDVTTSGATLRAAARILVQAGAAKIDAVVAAKHTLH